MGNTSDAGKERRPPEKKGIGKKEERAEWAPLDRFGYRIIGGCLSSSLSFFHTLRRLPHSSLDDRIEEGTHKKKAGCIRGVYSDVREAERQCY